MTICPCCGGKSTTSISEGCAACGARSVGEPLPRPENELPSYGRSLALSVAGILTLLVFAIETIASFLQKLPTAKTYGETFAAAGVASIDFWTWVAAAQTAAWKLKWVAIPFTFLVLFGARKVYRSVKKSPDRFCGLMYARRGYLAMASVPLLIAILIGMTVPVRWERYQWGREARFNSQALRIDRALQQYRNTFGTFPSDLGDLSRLPDQDGSLLSALKDVDTSTYKPSAEVAAVPTKKPKNLRGAVIRNVSLETTSDMPLNDGLSFTNYELTLPGYDQKLGTDDDIIVRDGVVDTVVNSTPHKRQPVTKAKR